MATTGTVTRRRSPLIGSIFDRVAGGHVEQLRQLAGHHDAGRGHADPLAPLVARNREPGVVRQPADRSLVMKAAVEKVAGHVEHRLGPIDARQMAGFLRSHRCPVRL